MTDTLFQAQTEGIDVARGSAAELTFDHRLGDASNIVYAACVARYTTDTSTVLLSLNLSDHAAQWDIQDQSADGRTYDSTLSIYDSDTEFIPSDPGEYHFALVLQASDGEWHMARIGDFRILPNYVDEPDDIILISSTYPTRMLQGAAIYDQIYAQVKFGVT